MSEENGYRYTCNEYREEMRLFALKRKLEQPDLSDAQRAVVQTEVRELEARMGME